MNSLKNCSNKPNQFWVHFPAKMPGSENDTKEKIALGKALYFEKALSINDSQSCNSCHDLTNGKMGVDNEPTSPGAKGERGGRKFTNICKCWFSYCTILGWEEAPDLKSSSKGSDSQSNRDGHAQRRGSHQKLTAMEQYPKCSHPLFLMINLLLPTTILQKRLLLSSALISKDRFDEFLAVKQML